jgi:ATP-binding cassette, subfamily B, bacterial PglK
MIAILKKILSLFTGRERKRLYLLFAVMTISGIIEVAGVTSIMPFLTLISNQNLINENRIYNWFYVTLKFQSSNRFLIFTGAMVLLILIISNSFALLTNWALLRFTWMRNFTLSKRLLGEYLYQPYVFFLNQNTSGLGKNILSEVQLAVRSVVVPLINIFSRGIVAIFIFALLLAVDPRLALIVMVVLGGTYVFIYRIIRKKLFHIGQRRFNADTERFKAVNEAFGGIKQVKFLGCEEVFINRFSGPSIEFSKHNASNGIISETPRYIMEILAFGAIIVIALYLLATAKGFQDFLPFLGLYAFATYRLMPALEKIFVSVTQVRFHNKTIETLYHDMNSFEGKSNLKPSSKIRIEPLDLRKELKLEGITFGYPGTEIPVIHDLNIIINARSSVAFVGETGAGKTTIADIILGLLRPVKGRIIVDGVDITDENIKQWQRNLGYIPQDIYLQDDSVTKNIAFGIPDDKIKMDAVKSAAKVANIHDFIETELSNGYQTIIGERGVRLSGGQRQRIGIARALYHDPEVLVLDEATSSLDGATETAVFNAIENISKTKTLIIIAHRLTTIQSCDVIYVLESGKIIGQGRYDELIKSNATFKKLARVHL